MSQNPSVLLSGEQVDQMVQLLSTPVVFVRAQDGSLRPFVDPAPIVAVLSAAKPLLHQPQTDQPSVDESEAGG